MKRTNTSWEKAAKWYNKTVGTKGHYFHQHIVIPETLTLLNLQPGDSVLDLACGQGVLARSLPKACGYLGIDASKALLEQAERQTSGRKFMLANLATQVELAQTFTHATCILAVQNIENTYVLFSNAAKHLKEGGKFVIVLNHPCFRIPRHSDWETDTKAGKQYRRIGQYLSELRIPILVNPALGKASKTTLSFHKPLQSYFSELKRAGFCVTDLKELTSDKESFGSKEKLENNARKEIPLFMALVCEKI